MRRKGAVYLLDEVPYRQAWQWQQQLVAAYKAALRSTPSDAAFDSSVQADRLLLLQHPSVYTLGQGADPQFLRFDPHRADDEIYQVERGGEVTYHCPGQLVGYPILNLHHYRLDLHWYLRALEEVLIRTLGHYGCAAERVPGLTGVWLKGHKVAAIGIKVSRWITMHGFALNVCPDLSGFEKIVPCGIADKPVGSMAQFLPEVSLEAVRQVVIEQFEAVFEISLRVASVTELEDLMKLENVTN